MKIKWVLILAGLWFLAGVTQPLWLDEAISANVVKNNSYIGIMTNFSKYDFHPPGYYWVLKTWTSVFGYSEISLRMPSIIFILAAIYLVYKMEGGGAAVLLASNPLILYYSHETRMYALITFLLTLGIFFIKKERYLWAGIIAGVGFWVFYGSVFLTAAIFVYLVATKKYKPAGLFALGPIVALLAILPLLKQQMVYSKEMLATVSNWSLVLGKVNLKNLLLIPVKFTSGRISFYPKSIYYVIAGIWAIVVGKKMLKKPDIYSYLFWLSLGLGVVFSIFTPMLQYFRFIYLIPLMALVIREDKYISWGFIAFGLVYLLVPTMWREDWRSAARDLPSRVYMIDSFGDPIKYYNSNVEIVDIRKSISGDDVTVIPYGEEIHGVKHEEILKSQSYQKVATVNYRGLTKEVWHLTY